MDEAELGRWLTLAEVADRTGRHIDAVRSWAQRGRRSGRLRTQKNNRHELQAWLTPELEAELARAAARPPQSPPLPMTRAGQARALRLLEEGGVPPDAAVLDANLRGEAATPVAARLRALGVPFVLASAHDGATLAALGLGGAPNLGKPTDGRRLLAALAEAAGR